MLDKRNLKVLAIMTMVLITASMFMGCTESSDALVKVEGEDMTLSDLEDMETVSGSAKYQNRMGNWNEEADYEGVALNELVPDMDSNDILKVTAYDGYSQKFSYEQVNPTGEMKTIQGDLILAYSENGDKVPDWEDGPMIAVLPDDGEFSNADLNVTKSITSEFNRQTSAGSLWVKNVEKIEVEEDVYSDTETALTLEGTTNHDYSMEQIEDMNSYTGEGAFLNSAGNIEGPYEYKGVNVTSLVSNVHSGDDYTLEVEASDGYVMTYTSEQINGGFKTYDDQGNPTSGEDVTPILAYEEIGEEDLHGGPLRLVTIGENTPITDGHFWAKFVRYIRVKPAQEGWSLELEGIETGSIDKQTYESAATCDYHKTTYEDGEDTYGGLPLWIIVSYIDGADDPDGHYMFNSELTDKGYDVKVIAGDGFSASFPSEQVARNDSLLVANSLNGEPLTGDDFPLRLVGDDLSGKQQIKNIVKVELTDLPDVPTWSVTLNGTKTVEYDAMSFNALVDCGAHTAYHNFTDEGTDYNYKGVPLWILVGAVDDEEEGDHWTLDDDLVSQGYQVEVIAEDGYSQSFDISQVAHNDTIIVASELNGEPLPEEDAPLRITGEGLSGKMRVSQIAEIRLVGL